MTQDHSSFPDSAPYSQSPQSFANPQDALEEAGAPSRGVRQPRPLHLDAEGPGAREATHRRVLTQSKLPKDVARHTYVGGTKQYGDEVFGAESQRTGRTASQAPAEGAPTKNPVTDSRGPTDVASGRMSSVLTTAGIVIGIAAEGFCCCLGLLSRCQLYSSPVAHFTWANAKKS